MTAREQPIFSRGLPSTLLDAAHRCVDAACHEDLPDSLGPKITFIPGHNSSVSPANGPKAVAFTRSILMARFPAPRLRRGREDRYGVCAAGALPSADGRPEHRAQTAPESSVPRQVLLHQGRSRRTTAAVARRWTEAVKEGPQPVRRLRATVVLRCVAGSFRTGSRLIPKRAFRPHGTSGRR